MMKTELAEDIFEDGIEALHEKLGTIKTIKFFQLAGVTRGDSLKEIEEKTERMSKEEALKLIRKVKSERIDLWEKIGVK
ncbi:MAG: hypothetical protein ACNYVW_07790 [Methanosarcinales archaeon]